MKVVVAGNYSISVEEVAMHLLQQLAELPISAEILLRAPLSGQPGPLESLAESLAHPLDIQAHWRLPQPGSGREGTLERDFDMVDESDLVLVYFDREHIMDPERGTTRLVEHALNTRKAVRAFAPQEQGQPVWIGEQDALHSGP